MTAARIFKPDNFHDRTDEDPETWFTHFTKVTDANQWTDTDKLRMFPVFLKDAAKRWVLRGNYNAWETDPADVYSQGIKTAFLNHFLMYTRKIK